MSRHFSDWIKGYMDYAKFSEAPKRMHFWVAVSAIAGALRRRVWIDMAYFKWHPNFYIVLVAPPGIVSKSTTAGIGMSLLRRVPGVHFGPDVVTWPALVQSFSEATEAFEYEGQFLPMSAMTLESSEFGNLLNPQDREMVDLLVSLWDGKQGSFKKSTKHSGNDTIENPWINLIACTTPAWIAGNFPEYMIGGGFTSRCIFVYADHKEQFVAYPHLHVPADLDRYADALVSDLEHISTLAGPIALTPEAIAYGQEWYEHHYTTKHEHLDGDRFGGYIARKQTHIHKLAMILSIAENDSLQITAEHLETANTMVSALEEDVSQVFAKIGKSEASIYADRMIDYIYKRNGVMYRDAHRYMHAQFPGSRDFEDIVSGAIKSGQLRLVYIQNVPWLLPGIGSEASAEGGGAVDRRGGEGAEAHGA